MTVPSDASSGGNSGNWLFKNKEHGKTSAAASLVCMPLQPWLLYPHLKSFKLNFKIFVILLDRV